MEQTIQMREKLNTLSIVSKSFFKTLYLMNQIQIRGTKDTGENVIVSFPYDSLEAAISDLQRRVVEFKWFIDKIIIE